MATVTNKFPLLFSRLDWDENYDLLVGKLGKYSEDFFLPTVI